MTEIILDASVLLKWFQGEQEPGRDQALTLRRDYEAGSLVIVVPPLLFLEVLNVLGRRRRWPESALLKAADELEGLGFRVMSPNLAGVARWVGAGLTAYDGAYVALAEARGCPVVVTDDEFVLRRVGASAVRLADYQGPGAE